MTNQEEPSAANSPAAAYTKACESYFGMYRAIFEQWNAHAASPTSMPPPAAFANPWQELAQRMGGLGVPALGLAREHVEMAQKMSDLGAEFQRNYAAFTAHLASAQPEAGRSYDEWIENAEAAYGGLAHGATFARLLADMCNTLSAMKVQRGKMLEYLSRQLDLPTRAEVDSLHQQVRLLREESRKRRGSGRKRK